MTQGVGAATPFAEMVGKALKQERFVVLDIGASWGIDPGWRVFAPKLTAFGFDPSVKECERLNRQEKDPNVKYVPAFVGVPEDSPIKIRRAGRAPSTRNPWWRLSCSPTMKRREEKLKDATLQEKLDVNAWQMTELADASKPLHLPDFLRENGVDSVDFLKIDIDGEDFDVIQSLREDFQRLGVLGVAAEVNFYGAPDDHEHVFHNTDRFMRQQGFDLFGLSQRYYSMSALPQPFNVDFPASTVAGRPYQGDALYARDLFHEWQETHGDFSDEKCLKLAAIFSLINLPDMAAEILVRLRERLQGYIDIDEALDVLARQAQGDSPKAMPYKKYIAEYERDAPMFYPPKNN